MNSVSSRIKKMSYYVDRAVNKEYLKIANKCVNGEIYLCGKYYYDTNNFSQDLFTIEFEGEDSNLKREYLFSLDFLSYVLKAYKETKEEKYKKVFNDILKKLYDYFKSEHPIYKDLAIYGQTLVIIKALDILQEFENYEYFLDLLSEYTVWLMNDDNYSFNNNHGLFIDLALLHIAVLLENHENSKLWKKHAILRVSKLFEKAYFNDYSNNEHSLTYFFHNNKMYSYLVDFCDYYGITGVQNIKNKLLKSENILKIFAHQDGTFPVIGDGRVFEIAKGNQESKCLQDLGVAILKKNDFYVSYKVKTVFQSHAHSDMLSITVRYKNMDLVLDSGQYNYDRYTPINRYLRSTAGHSGIYPIYMDAMFQKDICAKLKNNRIYNFKNEDCCCLAEGQYTIEGTKVKRKISIEGKDIIIKDSWKTNNPTTLRQRFIIPSDLISKSKFYASRRLLVVEKDNISIVYQITTEVANSVTTVQFGIYSPQYNEMETTMNIDTNIQNTTMGEIIARISVEEKE